jgi:hypothetical protein
VELNPHSPVRLSSLNWENFTFTFISLFDEVLHSYANTTALPFCRNYFIDVYRRMLIAPVEFMLRRSRE